MVDRLRSEIRLKSDFRLSLIIMDVFAWLERADSPSSCSMLISNILNCSISSAGRGSPYWVSKQKPLKTAIMAKMCLV